MGLEQCPAQAHHPAQTLHRNLNQLSSHFRNRRSARTATERERRSTEWEIRSEITKAQNGKQAAGNLPIQLLMPNTFQNIKEIAPKTIPSNGFVVDEARTLNMGGKKKKWGGLLNAKPDYKKAYVTSTPRAHFRCRRICLR